MRQVSALVALAMHLAWAQSWVGSWDGGYGGDDQVAAVDLTSEGDVFVIGGMSRGTYDFGAALRLSPEGEVRWLAEYDRCPGFDQRGIDISVAQDSTLYVVFAGRDSDNVWTVATAAYDTSGSTVWSDQYSHSSHHMDFPSGVEALPGGGCMVGGTSASSSSDYDFVAIRYDPLGSRRWVRRLDGGVRGIDQCDVLLTGGHGNIGLAGFFSVEVDASREYATMVAYDSTGTPQWTRVHSPFGPYDHSHVTDATWDSGGCAYVVGDAGTVLYPRMLIMKLMPDGDTAWTNEHGHRGQCTAVGVDSESNVYVVGNDEYTASTPDVVVVKYSPSGAELWSARYDGPDQMGDWGYDLALGPDGSVYVCGSSESADFGHECILIKYSASGDTVWTARIRGDGRYGTVGNAVAVDVQGNIIVAGSINKSSTGNDYLIAKYPPTGPGIMESSPRPAFACRHEVCVTPNVARTVCLLAVNAVLSGHRFVVSDLVGGVVRRLRLHPQTEHGASAVWNLEDDRGRPVPNGVYFVTLDSPGQSACAKIVVQR